MTSTPSSRNTAILPYLALGAGILALGMSAIFVRWADAPGPVTGFYRLSLSALILTPFVAGRCKRDCTKNKSALVFPLLGGLFTALDLALWNTSMFYTTVSAATLLGNTAPLWVALGAWLLFHEQLKMDFWLGLLLALAGAGLIMGSDFLTHLRLGIGDLMAGVSGIFYASYYLVTQRGREHYTPLTYVWLVGISAGIGLALINLALGHPLLGYGQRTWVIFFSTAIVSQLIGYASVSYAMGHLPASVVAPTMIGQPIMTTILAIPLLGETPLPIQVVGGVIALAGIYLVNQAHHRVSPTA
ncbi:MAG: DMT family transporter [Chloroflexi bacterium]|nr:DMT family transporter [Chloroflexota bacterium]